MKSLSQVLESLSSLVEPITSRVRRAVIGSNNEKLDFLIDSFYKLSPDQRAVVIFGGGAAMVVALFGVLFLYFSRITALESELNDAFEAVYTLQNLKTEYDRQNREFEKMVSAVTRKVGQGRYKPFFEKTALDVGAKIEGLSEAPLAIAEEDPLSKSLSYVKVDLNATKISLPRLLNYLIEVEKSNNFLTVETLSIRARFDDKLYFDAKARVRGYGPSAGGGS